MFAPEMPRWMAEPPRTARDRCRVAIFRVLDGLCPAAFLRFRAHRRLIQRRDSYLYSTGWMQSFKARRPVDGEGDPIPWMNFTIVGLLKQRLTSDLRLFEYGSGYSTLFYAGRVDTVTSVEYDKRWFEFVKAHAPANATVLFREGDVGGEYCRAILAAGGEYDVVVVDGTDRANCLGLCLQALSPRGVVILDDSERPVYREAVEATKADGFHALDLEGLKPNEFGVAKTTVFYRPGNCLGL